VILKRPGGQQNLSSKNLKTWEEDG